MCDINSDFYQQMSSIFRIYKFPSKKTIILRLVKIKKKKDGMKSDAIKNRRMGNLGDNDEEDCNLFYSY